jgi:hypothetical protein
VLVSVALAVTGLWEPARTRVRTGQEHRGVRRAGGRCRDTDRSAAGVGASVRVRRGRLHRRAETLRADTGVVDLPLQPWTTTQATWIAVALFVAGAVLCARFGPRVAPSPGAKLWLSSGRRVTSGDEAGASLTRILRAGGRLEDASW